MSLRQEKEKGCVCGGGVNAESVLLTVRVVKGFAVPLEAKRCSRCPPHHVSLGAGRCAESRECIPLNIS